MLLTAKRLRNYFLRESSLVGFVRDKISPYAIFPHTQGADGLEFGSKNLWEGTDKSKADYTETKLCGKQDPNHSLHYALHAASQGSNDRAVELLLNKDADVNTKEGDYGNALQAASQEGHSAIVKLLLSKGADVNARGDYGNALQAASQGGHLATIELLLSEGADVNAGGDYGNALQAASQGGHEKAVTLVLETGKIDADSRDDSNRTRLLCAEANGHGTMVKLLHTLEGHTKPIYTTGDASRKRFAQEEP